MRWEILYQFEWPFKWILNGFLMVFRLIEISYSLFIGLWFNLKKNFYGLGVFIYFCFVAIYFTWHNSKTNAISPQSTRNNSLSFYIKWNSRAYRANQNTNPVKYCIFAKQSRTTCSCTEVCTAVIVMLNFLSTDFNHKTAE